MELIELGDRDAPPETGDWALIYRGPDGGCRMAVYHRAGAKTPAPVASSFEETVQAARRWARAHAAKVYVKAL